MECTIYRILITGYIDNELSGDEMRRLKSHLQTCEECVGHLQKMERMQTVLKRYKMVQEVPEAPPNFARNISRVLQETTPAEPRLSFPARALSRYRRLVLRLVERWISSLRVRPVTWVTAMSCALVFMAGVVFMDITHTVQPPPRYALLQPNQQRVAENRQRVATAQQREESQRTPQYSPILDVAVTSDATNSDISGLPDFIQFSDEPMIRVAKTNSEPVVSYIYSHIVEASQEQFLDDTLFAAYVQDALFQ